MVLTYGEKVKLLRAYLNWNQKQLAEKINVERSLLSYFENGKANFNTERIGAIEQAFGVTSLDAPIEQLLAQLSPTLRDTLEEPVAA